MPQKRISSLVRPEIQALKSYHVPNSDGLLKLDAMENPHRWPGELLTQWQECLCGAEVNRYPDPSARQLKQKLSALMALDSLAKQHGRELDILLGNGSDEIIQIIAMALAAPGRAIMAPEPSFVMYSMIATYVGMEYIGVPLAEDFELDTETFVSEIRTHQPALIFLAVPNNPTGNVFELESIERIIEASDGLVVLDEAYIAFTDSDLLELCASYDNVVVMRTLSKVGLAGLRLGFLMGEKAWLEQFEKIRLPYNINVLTQASASFAIDHYDVLQRQTRQLREERSRLHNELVLIDALEPFESEANFILVRVQGGLARPVFELMKSNGVLVKCLDGAHPMLSSCLRLTVGTAQENNSMLKALSEALEEANKKAKSLGA